jgi:hypothetical protein
LTASQEGLSSINDDNDDTNITDILAADDSSDLSNIQMASNVELF